MTDRPRDTIDWTLTTWEGNRRAQLERWASMSLDEIFLAQEEVAKLSDELARQRENPQGGHAPVNRRQVETSRLRDDSASEPVEITTDDVGPVAPLTPEQQAWVQRSAALWRRAHAVAHRYPDLDAGDVYHALRCLELSPEARLRRGLSRGRLRAHAR